MREMEMHRAVARRPMRVLAGIRGSRSPSITARGSRRRREKRGERADAGCGGIAPRIARRAGRAVRCGQDLAVAQHCGTDAAAAWICHRGRHKVWESAQGLWVRPAERGCGLVTQRPALFPAMTARDNIVFGLHALPREERERRVEEMAGLFRLEPLLSRRPSQLSGGEQQRVAVARTLAPHPRVLLLDEPFAGLHLDLKDAILTDLETWLAAAKTPVLYVTHDVAEAWRVGSRPGAEVLRMDDGRIVSQGTAAAVLAAERTRLLAALE